MCPKCKSKNIKKVSVMDPNWKCGSVACKDCDYQGNWVEFVSDLTNEQKELFSYLDRKINKN